MVWWQGVVEDRKDPLKLGRCRVRILGYHTKDKETLPTKDLQWSYPAMPLDSSPHSVPVGPLEGTWVMGFFRDGEDAQEPIMTHCINYGYHTKPSKDVGFSDPETNTDKPETQFKVETGEINTHRLSRNEKKDTWIEKNEKIRKKNVLNAKGDIWSEPESKYDGKYPYNHVEESESGHIFEVDDTPDHERLVKRHKSGTFEELHPDGTRVTKVLGNDYTIVVKTDDANGDANVYVEGTVNITTGGDANIKTGGTVRINADKQIRLDAGFITMNAPGGVYIEAPIFSASGAIMHGAGVPLVVPFHVPRPPDNQASQSFYEGYAMMEATVGYGKNVTAMLTTQLSMNSVENSLFAEFGMDTTQIANVIANAKKGIGARFPTTVAAIKDFTDIGYDTLKAIGNEAGKLKDALGGLKDMGDSATAWLEDKGIALDLDFDFEMFLQGDWVDIQSRIGISIFSAEQLFSRISILQKADEWLGKLNGTFLENEYVTIEVLGGGNLTLGKILRAADTGITWEMASGIDNEYISANFVYDGVTEILGNDPKVLEETGLGTKSYIPVKGTPRYNSLSDLLLDVDDDGNRVNVGRGTVSNASVEFNQPIKIGGKRIASFSEYMERLGNSIDQNIFSIETTYDELVEIKTKEDIFAICQRTFGLMADTVIASLSDDEITYILSRIGRTDIVDNKMGILTMESLWQAILDAQGDTLLPDSVVSLLRPTLSLRFPK